MASWTTVARTDELTESEITGAMVNGDEVLVVRVGNEYRAIGAECTHAGCSLVDDGQIDGGNVECGCHGSVFDLATGEVVNPPAAEPVPVYEVRVEGDEVQIAGRG